MAEIKRLTTETPDGMVENLHNGVFVKDWEVWLRYLGDNSEPINLIDYVKKYMSEYKDVDNEEFMDLMCDDWGDELAPAFYHLAVGFAEVRERLKAYEDKAESMCLCFNETHNPRGCGEGVGGG